MPAPGIPSGWSKMVLSGFWEDVERIGGVTEAADERHTIVSLKGMGWSDYMARRLIRGRRAGLLRTGRQASRIETPGVSDDLPHISRWDEPSRPTTPSGFHKINIPEDEEPSIEELLSDQERRFHAAKKRAATLGVRQLKMPPGPYAIAHFGDPHLDDDGCDWPALRRAVKVVASTQGMYAGNVGDVTNNWVGNLTRLHGEQHATVDDAWRLARWLLESVPWLYLVLGNHDLWNQGAGRYKLLTEQCRIGHMAPDEAKLELLSPGVERPLRLHIRHNFGGNSQWNDVHGPLKAAMMDGWGDVYVAGHIHKWGKHSVEGPDGRIRWALRARGFKRFDSYARTLGYPEHQHGEVVTTVIDPTHPHPAERVQVFLDIEEAAEVVTWKRKRRGV